MIIKLAKNVAAILFLLFALIFVMSLATCGTSEPSQTAEKMIEKAQYQVAYDAEERYNIVVSQGDAMQRCVHAGLVAEAYLQAKDKTNNYLWTAQRNDDCRAVGITY